MDISCVVLGIFYIVIGVLFANGKVHEHIRAWKNMPEDEKDKINIIPLYTNVGEMIALSGIIFLVKGLWSGFQNHWFTIAMIAWMIIAMLDVFYISKSPRFTKASQ